MLWPFPRPPHKDSPLNNDPATRPWGLCLQLPPRTRESCVSKPCGYGPEVVRRKRVRSTPPVQYSIVPRKRVNLRRLQSHLARHRRTALAALVTALIAVAAAYVAYVVPGKMLAGTGTLAVAALFLVLLGGAAAAGIFSRLTGRVALAYVLLAMSIGYLGGFASAQSRPFHIASTTGAVWLSMGFLETGSQRSGTISEPVSVVAWSDGEEDLVLTAQAPPDVDPDRVVWHISADRVTVEGQCRTVAEDVYQCPRIALRAPSAFEPSGIAERGIGVLFGAANATPPALEAGKVDWENAPSYQFAWRTAWESEGPWRFREPLGGVQSTLSGSDVRFDVTPVGDSMRTFGVIQQHDGLLTVLNFLRDLALICLGGAVALQFVPVTRRWPTANGGAVAATR